MPVSMGYQQAHVVVYLWLSGLLRSNLNAATCSVLLCRAFCRPAPFVVCMRPSCGQYRLYDWGGAETFLKLHPDKPSGCSCDPVTHVLGYLWRI